MKKLMLFIFIVLIVLSPMLFPKADVFDLDGAKQVTIVTSASAAQNAKADYVQSGNKAFITAAPEKAKQLFFSLSGEAVIFEFDKGCYKEILSKLGMSETFSVSVENMQVTYGHTSKFDKSVIVDGKKVNVEIAVRDNDILVGFPMIVTGY